MQNDIKRRSRRRNNETSTKFVRLLAVLARAETERQAAANAAERARKQREEADAAAMRQAELASLTAQHARLVTLLDERMGTRQTKAAKGQTKGAKQAAGVVNGQTNATSTEPERTSRGTAKQNYARPIRPSV